MGSSGYGDEPLQWREIAERYIGGLPTTMESAITNNELNNGVSGNGNVTARVETIMGAWPQLWAQARQTAARIAIKAKGKILLIDPADVMAVEAKGNYALVQQASGSHLLRESISTMEEKLNPLGFVRIHRSVLVNAAWVEEIQPKSTGEYIIRLTSKEYIVTRTYRKNLRLLAQSWIGACPFLADQES